MKLSDRAALLLILVKDYTIRDASGQLEMYWVPRHGGQFSSTLKGYVYVSGARDAPAFRALTKRGLITKQSLSDYSFSLSLDGASYFDKEIVGDRLASLREIVARNDRVMNGEQPD